MVDKNQALLEMASSGPPLGLFLESSYAVETHPLVGGERIYMVTDGLYEWEVEGEIWGWRSFVEFVKQNSRISPQAFWEKLQDKIHPGPGENREAEDDQTFLYWERKT